MTINSLYKLIVIPILISMMIFIVDELKKRLV